MKATGVVRRIDDLGRVVIPKEIRKTLRIKEGDPLEIFTDREGQVILKKYSPIGELSEFASGYAETLSKTTGHIACITDKDTIIAVSGGSKKEFLEQEKNNLKQIINSKIDNKTMYALNRCIEEMYKNKPYGLYKYGYIEDLDKLDEKNLYEDYKKLLNEAKIDIFVSGNFGNDDIIDVINENRNIVNLKPREDKHIINTEEKEKEEKVEVQTIQEPKDVTQGKLVIGLDIDFYEPDSKYAMCLYNVILGESATSKMFQNVREKAGLAYSARSTYVRQKNNIFIRAGIEISNYEKAVNIIKEQLEDMKNGKFTEEDIENAKKYMVAGIKTVQDEQDSEITYYYGQELSNVKTSIPEYLKSIEEVSKQDIIDVANNININTIYFLRD